MEPSVLDPYTTTSNSCKILSLSERLGRRSARHHAILATSTKGQRLLQSLLPLREDLLGLGSEYLIAAGSTHLCTEE